MANDLYKGKMWANQLTLPHLPVPTLDESIPLFLESIKPLCNSDEEFEKTKEMALKLKEQGKQLQELLEKRAMECNEGAKKPPNVLHALHPDGLNYPNTHWLEQWWEKYAYLAWPESLLWVNVFQVGFGSQPCTNVLGRAAGMVVGLLDFRDMLLSGNLPMESASEKGKFLCNAQQLRILSCTRIPSETCDRLIVDHYHYRHICVSSNGFWYQVQVLNKSDTFDDGPANIISIDRLQEELEYIRKDSLSRREKGNNIAVLTTMERPKWAKTRLSLLGTYEQNAESLRSLETAIFHVVFSDLKNPPTTYAEAQRHVHRADNGKEIWLDKSITIVIFSNGVAGVHIEHSAADAVVPSRMAIHCQVYASIHGPKGVGYSSPNEQDLKKILQVPQTPIRSKASWNPTYQTDFSKVVPWKSLLQSEASHRLDFYIDDVIQERIVEALKFADELLKTNSITALTIPKQVIGDVSRIKNIGMAPDSFMQMVLQLAYARDQPSNPIPATYETGMTRNFLHGRTETIRTQSVHSKFFATKFDNPKVSDIEKRNEIYKAVEYHRNYTKRAVQAKGVDRHFLGLRLIAAENNLLPLPELFTSKAYQTSVNYTLSTSQMPWGTPDHPGFCAPSDDAYGVCYRFVVTGGIIATVSSRSNNKTKDAQRFCDTIYKSAVDLMEFLEKTKPSKL